MPKIVSIPRYPKPSPLFQDTRQRLNLKGHFLNTAIDGLIGGLTLPLRKIPLKVSAAWGVIGWCKPTEPDPAAVLNFTPFVNGVDYFTDSCLGWGTAGLTFSILAYVVSAARCRNFYGPH